MAEVNCGFVGVTGIGMSLFSYGGVVRATVVLDRTAGDGADVPTIIEEFEKEVASLARSAGVGGNLVFQTGEDSVEEPSLPLVQNMALVHPASGPNN